MLEKACGYDTEMTEWLQTLKVETDSVCTPINPKARCDAVAAMALCRHTNTYYEVDDTGQRVLNSAFSEIVPRFDSRFTDVRDEIRANHAVSRIRWPINPKTGTRLNPNLPENYPLQRDQQSDEIRYTNVNST